MRSRLHTHERAHACISPTRARMHTCKRTRTRLNAYTYRANKRDRAHKHEFARRRTHTCAYSWTRTASVPTCAQLPAHACKRTHTPSNACGCIRMCARASMCECPHERTHLHARTHSRPLMHSPARINAHTRLDA